MEYYVTVKHQSLVGLWSKLDAGSLTAAKRKATKMYSDAFLGHVINLVECENTPYLGTLNDIPAHCKTIGDDFWYKIY